jgi:hypothetical protein
MHFDEKDLRPDWHGMLDPLAHDVLLATGIDVGDLGSAPLGRLEDIPQFADSPNGGFALPAPNGSAQAHDFRINGGFFDRRAGPPHALLQGSPRQGFSRMLHENLKETKLLHGQLKRLAAPPNPDGLTIEKEFANDDQGLRRWLCRTNDLIHVENRYYSTFAKRSSSA